MSTPDLWRSYLTNQGYTFNHIDDGLKQALIANGATGGSLEDLWIQYLVAQGYTSGTLADRLYLFLGDKGYTGSLHDRWAKALIAEDVFAAGFDWTTIFGVSDDGFVFDGLLSKVYTDSGMTTEATTSGSDPVGAVEDISGKGNHLLQTSSANKPVYYVNGGVKGWRSGLVSAVDRRLEKIITLGSAFTFIIVRKHYNSGAEFSHAVVVPDSPPISWYDTSTRHGIYNGSTIASVDELDNPRVCIMSRSGTGTNQTKCESDGLACDSFASATTATTPSGSQTLYLGSAGGLATTDPADTFLMMYINRTITADERASILAYIVANYGVLS